MLEKIICPICGSHLLEGIGESKYRCKYCGGVFNETTPGIDAVIRNSIDSFKQEQFSNAKKNLLDQAHEEYLSDENIIYWANEVQKFDPNDFLAETYKIAVSGTPTELIKFLNNIDRDLYKDYLYEVVRFLIKTVDSKMVIQTIKSFLDNPVFDIATTNKFYSEIEDLSQKLDDGIFRTDISRDVFIAYSSKDIVAVNNLVTFFEQNNISCFTALRNLRHGKGAVENYQKELFTAMKHSKCIVFVSSENSRSFECDALSIEIPFAVESLPNVGRIELLIQKYGPKTTPAVKEYLKNDVFPNLEYCTNPKDMISRIASYKSKLIAASLPRYCKECGEENPFDAKTCKKCGHTEFYDTKEEFIKSPNYNKHIEAATSNAKPKKKKKFIAAIAACVVGILIATGVTTGVLLSKKGVDNNTTNQSISETVEEYFTYEYLSELDAYAVSANTSVQGLYNGSVTELTIPLTYNNKMVVAISENGFKDTTITAVKIPYYVQTIGNSAFYNCTNCRKVEIGYLNPNDTIDFSTVSSTNSKLTSIGEYAFAKSALVNINLVEELSTIGNNAFESTKIEKVVIPANVKEIGSSAFSNCSELTSVELKSTTYADSWEDDWITSDEQKSEEILLYPLNYKLNWRDNDDDNLSTVSNATVYYQHEFSLLVPTKAGFTFLGWSINKEDLITDDKGKSKSTISEKSDLTLFAMWKPNEIYSISYELNGGVVDGENPTQFDISTKTFTLINPTKEGYEFIGWSLNGSTEKVLTITIEKGSKDSRNYIANFAPISYSITYNYNGGINSNDNPILYNIETKTFELFNPIRLGYTFSGWSGTDITGTSTDVQINNGSIGNREYTANWALVNYNISYNLDGGTIDGTLVSTYNIESDTFTLPNPTKVGYDFAGWQSGTTYSIETNVTIKKGSVGNKQYFAMWYVTVYPITYKLNGGVVSTSNPTTYNIETNTFTLNNPTKDYYTFTGWSGTGLSGQSKNVSISKGSTGERSYSANWKIIDYTITYNLDGGTNHASNPSSYTIEDTISLNGPTKDTKVIIKNTTSLSNGSFSVERETTQYAFDGWYLESTFDNKVSQISGHEAISLFAKWVEDVSTTTTTEQAYSRNGNSIEFGSYPQSEVADSTLISTLNTKAGTLPTESDSKAWTSYGYYISGKVSNYMWYIDLEDGGEKYRGVYFTQYRPNSTYYSSSPDYSEQDDNGYNINIVYWFKYEPIKWTIVEESNGYATLVCDIAIDSQEYYSSSSSSSHSHNGGEGYSNNYALSNIRKWLNETFYNTAFNELQKLIIQTIEVDNGALSTEYSSNPYVCENTNDNVYLLSYKETTTYYTTNASMQKKSSDYAKSQGWSESKSSSYLGYWWLRSPTDSHSFMAVAVLYNGAIGELNFIYSTKYGVVPALKIKL